MEEESLEFNKGLTREDLWDIAKYITNKQQNSKYIPEDTKPFIPWNTIEDDWFDILEEIIFPEDES